MRYLVIGEGIESSQLVPPNEMAQFIEQTVIPSLETMTKMENDKKVLAGGIYAGSRTGVAIIEAESNEECSRLIQSLPFWGALKWTITPLETFSERAAQTREAIKRMK